MHVTVAEFGNKLLKLQNKHEKIRDVLTTLQTQTP